MQELELQPGTLDCSHAKRMPMDLKKTQQKLTHPTRTKERGGNTTEPTENTEEPISITADNII